MGLDMYLVGKKYFAYNTPERKEDGFDVEEITVKLGYWRKVPDLHGYIVQNFGPEERDPLGAIIEDAPRIDDCQPIRLTMEHIKQIIEAVQNDELPETGGFFFGKSYKPGEQGYEEERAETLQQLGNAVNFLSINTLADETEGRYWRSVEYRASW